MIERGYEEASVGMGGTTQGNRQGTLDLGDIDIPENGKGRGARDRKRLLQAHYVGERLTDDWLEVEELFDTNAYEECLAVTYSVTPSFTSRYLSDFSRVEVVIGIPEPRSWMAMEELSERQRRTAGSLDQLGSSANIAKVEERVRYLDSFEDDLKRRFISRAWCLWYSVDQPIHSKMVLLRGDAGTRVMLGSPNLSYQAYDVSCPQYESLIIRDGDEALYGLCERWIRETIIPACSPCFSDAVIGRMREDRGAGEVGGKATRVELGLSQDKKAPRVRPTDDAEALEVRYVPLTAKDVADIARDEVTSALNTSNEHAARGMIGEDVQCAKRDAQEMAISENRARDNATMENESYVLISKSVTHTREGAVPRGRDLSAIRRAVRSIVPLEARRGRDLSDDAYPRPPVLIDRPDKRYVSDDGMVIRTGLFLQPAVESNEAVPFGMELGADEVRESLIAIGNLVETYKTWSSTGAGDDYVGRVMEAVMYSFTSPFLWEVRRRIADASTATAGLDVPPFLILGAAPQAGKSTLLESIARLIAVNGVRRPLSYNDYSKGRGNGSKTMALIRELMESNDSSVYPVLLDEVSTDAFNKNNALREMIKSYSNEHQTGDCAGTLVMTTNNDGATLPSDAMRRVYYLRFDNIMIKNVDSQEAKARMQARLNPDLFQDFCCRMAKALEEESRVWLVDAGDGSIDFLYNTRQIFKGYYEEAGLALPAWFPETLVDDQTRMGVQKWHDLYFTVPKAFEKTRRDGERVLVLNKREVFPAGRYDKPSSMESQYVNELPERVLWHPAGKGPDLTGPSVILRAKAFYRWAEISAHDRLTRR